MVDGDTTKVGHFCIVDVNTNGAASLENSIAVLQKLDRELTHDPIICLVGIY